MGNTKNTIPDFETLQSKGEYIDSNEGALLYKYNGLQYVVLCDNTVITIEEDNANDPFFPRD